jgi:cold shock CspA family protein
VVNARNKFQGESKNDEVTMTAPRARHFGVITFYNAPKRYGFITRTTGQSYFFHVTNFENPALPVLNGEVSFEVGPGISIAKKEQAINVRYRQPFDALAGKAGDGGAL